MTYNIYVRCLVRRHIPFLFDLHEQTLVFSAVASLSFLLKLQHIIDQEYRAEIFKDPNTLMLIEQTRLTDSSTSPCSLCSPGRVAVVACRKWGRVSSMLPVAGPPVMAPGAMVPAAFS